MKTPQELVGAVIGYALLAIAIGIGVFWFGSGIVAAIQAPVVAELGKAVGANDTLKHDNERLVQQNARMDAALTRRGEFEQRIDQRLAGMDQQLKALKAKSPAVKKWAEEVIPPEVLQ